MWNYIKSRQFYHVLFFAAIYSFLNFVRKFDWKTKNMGSLGVKQWNRWTFIDTPMQKGGIYWQVHDEYWLRDAPLDFQGGGSFMKKKITLAMRMEKKITPVRGRKKKKITLVSRGEFFWIFQGKKSPSWRWPKKKNPPPLSDEKKNHPWQNFLPPPWKSNGVSLMGVLPTIFPLSAFVPEFV